MTNTENSRGGVAVTERPFNYGLVINYNNGAAAAPFDTLKKALEAFARLAEASDLIVDAEIRHGTRLVLRYDREGMHVQS